jgi:hypothetical protein
MAAHDQPSPTPWCILFELPRELRDLVYRHALKHEGGLTIRITKHEPRMHVRARGTERLAITKTNPLLLVCRQTYHETKDLLSPSNSEVALYGMDYLTPSSYAFSRFTGQIGFAAVAQLQKVTVNGRPNRIPGQLSYKEVSSYFEGFTSFCASHPQTIVVIRFQCVGDVDGKTWLSECIALKELIRGSDTVKKYAALGSRRTGELRARLGSSLPVFRNLPSNLRFSILDAMPEYEMSRDSLGPLTSMWIKAILPYARELWEEGM